MRGKEDGKREEGRGRDGWRRLRGRSKGQGGEVDVRGWGSVRGVACQETLRGPPAGAVEGGLVRPGKKPGATARWCGGGRRRESPRLTGAGSRAKTGGRLERGAPSCGDTGDGTSALCGGAGPGPCLAAPKGGAFPERGRPWGLVDKARGKRC